MEQGRHFQKPEDRELPEFKYSTPEEAAETVRGLDPLQMLALLDCELSECEGLEPTRVQAEVRMTHRGGFRVKAGISSTDFQGDGDSVASAVGDAVIAAMGFSCREPHRTLAEAILNELGVEPPSTHGDS